MTSFACEEARPELLASESVFAWLSRGEVQGESAKKRPVRGADFGAVSTNVDLEIKIGFLCTCFVTAAEKGSEMGSIVGEDSSSPKEPRREKTGGD